MPISSQCTFPLKASIYTQNFRPNLPTSTNTSTPLISKSLKSQLSTPQLLPSQLCLKSQAFKVTPHCPSLPQSSIPKQFCSQSVSMASNENPSNGGSWTDAERVNANYGLSTSRALTLSQLAFVTQLLFHNSQSPSLKDFSFNGRTPRALRHVMDKLKKDYLNNPDSPFGVGSDDGKVQKESTAKPGRKRKAKATEDGSPAAKKSKNQDKQQDNEAA
jgi:hypothetical protein